MTHCDLILLNGDNGYIGLYTWERQNQNNVIDYALVKKKKKQCVSGSARRKLRKVKQFFDISNHALIQTSCIIGKTRGKNLKRWKEW